MGTDRLFDGVMAEVAVEFPFPVTSLITMVTLRTKDTQSFSFKRDQKISTNEQCLGGNCQP